MIFVVHGFVSCLRDSLTNALFKFVGGGCHAVFVRIIAHFCCKQACDCKVVGTVGVPR